MVNSGEYGGIVLRGFKGDGKSFISGAILTPEEVSTWPLANRMALHSNGFIDWYGAPSAEENKVREAGSPAPVRGKVAKAETKVPSEPKTAARRKR